MNHHLRRCLLAPLIVAAAPCAHAQLIDDVELRREGANTVVQVRFATAIQYRRSTATRAGDLVQAFYDVVPSRSLPALVVSERRLAGSGSLPTIVLTDDSAGRETLGRRLVIRFDTPVPYRVRAGRGDRTIEIVLEGVAPAGAAAPAPVASPTLLLQPEAQPAPQASARFQIALLQSDEPGLNLEAPIPSALQRYDVFTGQRRVDGRTVHEISIGYFDSEAEAESARRILLARFPKAALVALATTPPPTVAAERVVPAPAPPPPPPPPMPVPVPVPVPAPVPTVTAVAPPPAAPPTPPPAAAVAPPPVAVAAPVATPVAPLAAAADVDANAAALLAAAKQADAIQDHAFALARLNELLELPPNASSREAQELIGNVRLRAGDTGRARAEYETFLKLYPQGADADRVRRALAALGGLGTTLAGAPRQRPPVVPTSTITGSISEFYYGGQSKVRTQEFQDSPISGLPELASDNTLSGSDQRQLLSNADVNWRYRDTDTDMRFVFRDAYTADLMNSAKNRNRLSALYFEHRSLVAGTGIKLGRQSPTGGGVLNRFDGVQAAYTFMPKWRVNAVVGTPTDKLLDSKRHFYGAWVDAEALTTHLSGSAYINQQRIDGELDRRAIGSELRYFNAGVSVSSVLDYDLAIGGLNIASLQGTWQSPENTVVNVLYDRRATPLLMLGNALFFGAGVPRDAPVSLATSVQQLLANGYDVAGLRQSVKDTTTYTTQALLAVTTPLNARWQVGGDLRITKLGEIPAVPVLLPNGQGRSDNRSLGAQVIATNLYSARDTHVFGVSWLSGSGENLVPPTGRVEYGYSGQLVSYNNSSQLSELWLLEPSLKYYAQSDKAGVKTTRWSPGLRVTYRAARQVAIESELCGEVGKTSGPTRNESSNRVFYYLGGRYDF